MALTKSFILTPVRRSALALLWVGLALGCIQDPDSFETSVPDDLDLSRPDIADLDAADLYDSDTSPCSRCSPQQYCINDQCLLPQTCRQMVQWDEDAETGYYLIEPPGDQGDPLEVYCEVEADDGAIYTMVRLEGDELTDNQEDYRTACADIGMEIIVPRTRAHAQAILDFNDNTPPNIVGVYPHTDGAQGLHNWHGRCAGEPCSFYLNDSDSAGCQGDKQPTGDSSTEQALIRRGDGCFFGDWTASLDGALLLQGSVICSPNDAGPRSTPVASTITSTAPFITPAPQVSAASTPPSTPLVPSPPLIARCSFRAAAGPWSPSTAPISDRYHSPPTPTLAPGPVATAIGG